jgi:ABC-type cobalamin/Fe3+-siderophores transport system ATPase subunit
MTLDLRGVSFAYGGEDALRDVTASFGAGQLIALAGSNGSGKSTLLKLAARVLHPSRGEVAYDGRPLRDWPAKEYAKQVGYLPQEPEPAFPMRALDVVLSGRAPFLGRFTWESEDDVAHARRALELCDAAHLAERDLDAMSGGERKRIFLARVLAATPRVILLDEPLVDRTGSTVVFASHDLNWAAAYSDRMLVMRGGTLALDAKPAEVMRAEVVAELFGFDAQVMNGWLVPLQR